MLQVHRMPVLKLFVLFCNEHDSMSLKLWIANIVTSGWAGPMELARAHFEGLGHPTASDINIADRILDLVIRSPPAEASP